MTCLAISGLSGLPVLPRTLPFVCLPTCEWQYLISKALEY